MTWTKTGTPTAVAAPALLKFIQGAPPLQGMEALAGFSDSAYYSAPANSALDTASDFIISALFLPSPTNGRVLYCNGLYNTAGHYIQNVTGNFVLAVNGTTSKCQYVGDWPYTDARPHLVTWGKAGSTLFWKVDNQPVQTVALMTGLTYVNPTAYISYIGRYNTTGTYGFDGSLYEFYMSSTTPTASIINAIHTTAGFAATAGLSATPYAQLSQTAMGSMDGLNIRRVTTPKDTIGSRQSGMALLVSAIGRLLSISRGQDVPGQTFLSGPATNLWVARVVFRVLKPSWFYGLHPRGNKTRANFNPGMS